MTHAHAPAAKTDDVPAIRVRGITVGFGDKLILENLDLDVRRGEVLGFVGGSGTGKSVLTRTVLGLIQHRAGTIEVFGQDLAGLSPDQHRALERRWGVLFQQGALFSSLTVRQNIQVPMREYLSLSQGLMDEFSMLKIRMVGLNPDAADKFPSELSGGMIKRAPGYDPEHGDWEYFFFEDIAKIEHGKIASCVNCHHGAKDKDHVFKAWATPSSAPANPHPNTR